MAACRHREYALYRARCGSYKDEKMHREMIMDIAAALRPFAAVSAKLCDDLVGDCAITDFSSFPGVRNITLSDCHRARLILTVLEKLSD